MAGFETVVRPVVFPDIRPARARTLPPVDDPEKGMCVITGGGSFPVQLSHSTSVSTSKSRPVETERRSDEVRIYQTEDDGTVNTDNFVDLKVANRIKMRQEGDPVPKRPADKNFPFPVPLITPFYYTKLQPFLDGSGKILRRDVIDKNPDEGGGGEGD